jgi:hypothetical protein
LARRAILEVSGELLVALCKHEPPGEHFTITVSANALPDDARMVGWAGDVANTRYLHLSCIGIMVESAAFDDIPDDQPLPVLPAVFFTRHTHDVAPPITKNDTIPA